MMNENEAQQFRRMGQILVHVQKLDEINRDWLMRRLAEVECCSTRVGKLWTQPTGIIEFPAEVKRRRA
jgi:hypothetical protein